MRHRFIATVLFVVATAAATGVLVSAQTQPAPPRFEVDHFWPKPLPNRWLMGQVTNRLSSGTVAAPDSPGVMRR